jgi:multiple sugar transport system substrate-binding protein
LPYEIPFFPSLNIYFFLWVLLAIFGAFFCSHINDYLSLHDQRITYNPDRPRPAEDGSFFGEFTNSIVFASPDRINMSNLVSGNARSGEENGSTITLRGLFTDLGDKGRWKSLLDNGLERLQLKYPDQNLLLEYDELPTNDTREEFLRLMSNRSALDIVSVDQIWLGEFASKGLLSNLTSYVDNWGRGPDWYQQHWDGGTYGRTVYGIWTWTDVRGIWYWKDMLLQAQVNATDLKTWNGYIESVRKLNDQLEPHGVNGTILFDTYYSQDLWFPYLWMQGGDIVQLKDGHPSKGKYWFPTYNSTEGVRALGFIKDQIDAGVKPASLPASDRLEFAQKKIAVILGGSWIPGYFANEEGSEFEDMIGFIPMFPVPSPESKSSTLMGGWELAIPITSKHKEIAWELIEAILDPETLGPWIQEYGYLPTQIPLGQGLILNQSAANLPYYDILISMIPVGNIRPNIPEYPIIAGHLNEAIDRVYSSNFTKSDMSAILNEAAVKSARALGW